MQQRKKNILITGGSDGIGKSITELFLKNEANVWIVARSKEKLEKIKEEFEEHKGKIFISSLDLGNEESIKSLNKELRTHWDSLDVLINNAGTGTFKPVSELSSDDFESIFNLNVRAPFLLTRNLADLLRKSKGSIINISSYLAERMMPHLYTSLYSSTKGALNSLTKALALELGPDIRVNAISPGTVATALSKKNISNLPEERQKSLSAYIKEHYPMKAVGKPIDIAHMALFLASENANWITGSIVNVDGGLTTT